MVRPSNLRYVSRNYVTASKTKKSLLDVVHCLDCSVGILVLAIAHKSETAATTSIAILDNDLYHHIETRVEMLRWSMSYGFLDLTKFFELGAKSVVVGVPCKATADMSEHNAEGGGNEWLAYPMNSFDMIE